MRSILTFPSSLLVVIAVIQTFTININAFSPPPLPIVLSPPILGLGALFRPRNIKFVKSSDVQTVGGGKEGGEEALVGAGKFFVDAFWTGKVGGAKTLSRSQSSSLERQQIMEFKKRYNKPTRPTGSNRLPGNYAGRSLDKQSELVLCLDNRGDVIGCAGVEVERIKKMDGYDGTITAPLMSNLAISKSYRRKGLAEDLVAFTEKIARREWGYDDCYLYVEKRNVPAVKLYNKLGYKVIWEDDNATTLLPMKDGRGVANGKTTIVCMKKNLGGGLNFGNLFGT